MRNTCPICGDLTAKQVPVECKDVAGYEDLSGTMFICEECAGELEEEQARERREEDTDA